MSTPAAKALAEKKVKRQKQIIAVGSVVLLAVVGFQLPKLLGGGNDEASSTTTPIAASSTPAASSAAGGSLPDTDHVVIQRGSDQLLSFGLFKSKDPFVQQLSANPAVARLPPRRQVSPQSAPSASLRHPLRRICPGS